MKPSPQKKINKKPNGNIAIIVSRFNEEICHGLLKGCLKTLEETNFSSNDYKIYQVPGAFEIPLAASKVANTKQFQGIICLGAVIKGETPHFDFLCQAVTQNLCKLSQDAGIPVGFGIITTNNQNQALARSAHDDYNKGSEAASAVIEMMALLEDVRGITS